MENKCQGCDNTTEDYLCDDCFTELPMNEWVTIKKKEEK